MSIIYFDSCENYLEDYLYWHNYFMYNNFYVKESQISFPTLLVKKNYYEKILLATKKVLMKTIK